MGKPPGWVSLGYPNLSQIPRASDANRFPLDHGKSLSP
jgi:hypothetical protein